MKIKKIIAVLLAAVSIFAVSLPAFADSPSVYLNGTKLTFDADPFIENDRTLVPYRALMEAIGAAVMWSADTQTVISQKDQTSVILQVGNNKAFINGEEKELEVNAEVVNDRTFVPLRFMAEAMNADVSWDNDQYAVMITTK